MCSGASRGIRRHIDLDLIGDTTSDAEGKEAVPMRADGSGRRTELAHTGYPRSGLRQWHRPALAPEARPAPEKQRVAKGGYFTVPTGGRTGEPERPARIAQGSGREAVFFGDTPELLVDVHQ